MPLFDIINRETGITEEVYVACRSQLAGQKVAVSRIHVGGRPTEEPFSAKVLRGYRRQEAKGGFATAHSVNRIKKLWNK